MREKLRARFLRWLVGSFILTIVITGGIDIYLINNSSYHLGWEAFMVLVVGVLATVVSYFTFVQRQEVEEIRLFHELFDGFNKRYDSMNEKLNRLHDACEEDPEYSPCEDDIKLLYDYFNLCGEEYFYYTQDIIYPEVWKAWCHGIMYFLDIKKIKAVWDEEEKEQSPAYYGLTFDKIRQGQKKVS